MVAAAFLVRARELVLFFVEVVFAAAVFAVFAEVFFPASAFADVLLLVVLVFDSAASAADFFRVVLGVSAFDADFEEVFFVAADFASVFFLEEALVFSSFSVFSGS
ncbi:hypothetical protein BRCON_2326 [Candidatus Sumerlaea chitinivorans]|uniref:Uncharacterized protein n=1 Tax=Sumerlaea chitinivorans TaxID=2250252 RepID=A0A2Z4Y9L5_SUMC1|nr:hypothetical protein BRCON_2326 [Candidatus Sumerlaea chitinivorans]